MPAFIQTTYPATPIPSMVNIYVTGTVKGIVAIQAEIACPDTVAVHGKIIALCAMR